MPRKVIHSLFPSLVYQANLHLNSKSQDSKSFLRQLIKEAYILRDQDRAGQIWSKKNYPNGYTSYGSVDRLQDFSPSFAEAEKHLFKHLTSFLKSSELDCSAKELKLGQLWINIMSQGSAHGLHIHPRSVVSGTLYLIAPRSSSPIKFEDPRMTNFMNRPKLKVSSSKASQNHVFIHPKAGEILLFESWLKHEVPMILDRADRVSVSFNFDWK